MVWFYHIFIIRTNDGTKYFQSHYGLILSLKFSARFFQTFPAFNPTMVWFYRINSGGYDFYEKHLSIPLWSDFILQSVQSLRKNSLQPFNPTMVWFYHCRIRSQIRTSVLSIPLWSDFIINEVEHVGVKIFLSIPLWSDFIVQKYIELLSNLSELSIPLWSDFIERVRENPRRAFMPFHAHYGLILSRGLMGSWARLPVPKLLSIPLWSDFISAFPNNATRELEAFNPTMVWFYHENKWD